MNIREPAVAGTFYPAEKSVLEEMIATFLKKVPSCELGGKLKALIVPHAGYSYSGQVAAYAYALLQTRAIGKRNVVLLGPSHFVPFGGVAADTHEKWKTPLGTVSLAKNTFLTMEEAHRTEHCLEVQLPFLQKTLSSFTITPLVAGDAQPHETAQKLRPLMDTSLIIISSDLSHYHEYATAVSSDKATIDAILRLDGDALQGRGEACGMIPILTALEIAQELKWKCKLLEYKNSGDVSGYKKEVVGYASIAFYQ
jgi:AmmeMemoRadiSam system protein B